MSEFRSKQMRKSLLFATGLIVLIGIVVAVVLLLPERTAPKVEHPAAIASAPESKTTLPAKPAAASEQIAAPRTTASSPAPTNRATARESASSAERQLVAELSEISNGQN